ncbi:MULTISPECIES: ParB/RepB/Spo0J family partition protein [Pseudoalteromonas]|uniref:ParB/RepB/Spo0J family partition protein n=1 Tax=Pseudoalteromonas TaxID=53246 RepID=UPI0015828A8B|nr:MULTISPECIES: ParB/RepB/Spo0J family partition protein [Pseudoalteromonas]MDI4653635.1 ParB/RepB/Spo0J family partition protein [Pseudoalteromonas shioyasakiensis]NUJ39330.1 ParB/RepB/Spo0J family partition protein [Pseudoalteromonas sp. 0303]
MNKGNLDTSGFMDLISGVQGGEFEYVDDMPKDQCYPDPEQPRYKNLTAEGVSDITATFEVTKGRIWQPIVVREKDEKGHKVLMGGRRWLAVNLYDDVDTIPALVVKKDIDSAIFLQLMENIARRPLDVREEGKSFIMLKEEGKTQKEIAKSLGKSEPYVAESIMMYEMEIEPKFSFLNKLYEDKVCRDISTLAVLVRFARKDVEKTKELLQFAIDNNCLNRAWAKSLKVKDLETPIDAQIAALEERKEHEKRPNSKTPTPDGMTGDENALEEEFQLETEQDGVEPADKVQSEKVDKKSQAPESNDDESEETPFQKKRVTEINVMHNSKVAKLLLDRADKEEGFAWIQYDNSEEPAVRVDVSELSLIFVG